jgi:hypothetical protein
VPSTPTCSTFAEVDQPIEKTLETRSVGGKRFHTQQSTVVIDDCCYMGVSVRVDNTSNTYDSHGRPFRTRPKEWPITGTADVTQPNWN